MLQLQCAEMSSVLAAEETEELPSTFVNIYQPALVALWTMPYVHGFVIQQI